MPSISPNVASPFHRGEQEVQTRLGVRERIEKFAQRVVRDHMPDQHRAFFEMLPFMLLGSVDEQGRPWASLVAGRPGFITTPDARTVEFATSPLFGDPLNDTLKPGAEVGLLGIEQATRRRNRLTGRITHVGPDGFGLTIKHSFGNCPQYIQTRDVELLPQVEEPRSESPVERSDHFDETTRALIASADTLFIATAFSEDADDATHGADVSHRGGKPGFIRVEDDRTFVFPDFSGNNHYNTIGNILLNPKAGVLFPDFETGGLVYLTGSAEIVWEGDEVAAFAGAERLIRIRAEEIVRVGASLPMRFRFGDYSPMLELTGSWEQAAEVAAANAERNEYVPYEVFEVRPESDVISSFFLRRADGKALAAHKPGQFLPISVTIPGHDAPVTRTYTLSDAPNSDYYRLSIKREGGDALVSNFLHDQAGPGFRLDAMAPRGKFVLDQSSDRPIVFLSAGVGITPMIAMTNAIINEGKWTRNFRKTYFIHGARNSSFHAFDRHIRDLAGTHDSLTAHMVYSDPDAGDQLGMTHDSEGQIDVGLLKGLLPFDDYDFYLCGPAPFMQSLHDGLIATGVREHRIHFEAFGPATVRKPGAKSAASLANADPVVVRFTEADVDVTWSAEQGTLLELAEASGLAPAYSCRSGICGTCATQLNRGAVDYIEEPMADLDEGDVLICCAIPKHAPGSSVSSGDVAVELAL